MISKFELGAIFFSIAAMALVLAFWRFQGDGLTTVAKRVSGDQEAVVVAADSDSDNAALASAIGDAATTKGDLEKLVVDDVRIGTVGPEVKRGDTVTVQYEGRTQDGVRFDSSYERGEPFTFTVGAGRVIEGWEQGILGMRVGGERVLVIPPDMAYGGAQVGPIAPNSILVFKIELVSIK